MPVRVVATKPFDDQKPGTSGLRKKVVHVQQAHYLENFVQSVFDALPAKELQGSTLVVAGDGRYYNDVASKLIFKMAAANGVAKIVTAQHYLASTPAVSAVIRGLKAYGGIILTASHNPGGPKEDFGIKYNASNGGPAPESLTDVIFAKTKTIKEYRIMEEDPEIDASKLGVTKFAGMEIEVIDFTEHYTKLMGSIFDMAAIKQLLQRKDFSFVYDAMNGAAGPFARRIFIKELGASEDCLLNCVPKTDFGGGHPDPNLTYAHDLVARMGLASDSVPHGDHGHGDHGHGHGHGGDKHEHKHEKKNEHVPDFGAAADGDADRNMILGRRFFVTPSDSVALLAAYAHCIPYFRDGVKGVARSMPTSAALDRVAAKKNIKCYEVPTGWKFFGNLMDAGKLSICGEESFGTGSDHVREKDGIWAVLAWLQILAFKNKDVKEGDTLVSVEDIVKAHWKEYGRNYYCRYDYEGVDSKGANSLMADLVQRITSNTLTTDSKEFELSHADEFEYKDPVDNSVSSHQGIRVNFKDGSRFVVRLSGTGSVGATVRLYLEKYEDKKIDTDPKDAFKTLIELALRVTKMEHYIGRAKPDVIT